MPRPAAKRNRLTKAHPVASKDNANAPGIADKTTQNSTNNVQNQDGTSLSAAQQSKNHTPLTRSYEQAIGSSPTGERVATGSRPPTRARGYSSTLSIGGRKGDMSSRVPGTPAFESSILSNFHRRPRQGSILQMMQADDGSSDLDDDDFLGGLSPQDESTPLNVSRGKSLMARRSGIARSESPASPSSGGSGKRKRGPEELQVQQSPPGIVENTQGDPSEADDHHSEESASENTPHPQERLEAFSQTMAVPASSSPQHSPATASRMTSAGPETAREVSKRNHVSTAALQDRVLPRRRLRQRGHGQEADFDVPSDEDGYPAAEHDDDELSYLPRKVAKPANSQRKPTRKARTLPDPAANSRKMAPKKQNLRHKPPTEKRVYSAKRNSDKENRTDSESETSDANSGLGSAEPNAPWLMSEELRLQAKKFSEVDQWQMEYEDVTAGSQASSVV